MKRLAFAVVIIALVLAVSAGVSCAQQGSTAGQGGWYNCPMMGQGRATGPGGWYCPWMRGSYGHRYGSGGPSSFNQGGEPLTRAQAEQLLTDHIQSNPNLKVGDFADKGDFYEATIVTRKEGALVEKIQVDKKTGWFRNAPS
jgi:hypothetical protein